MVDKEFSWRRCLAWTVAMGVHAALFLSLSVPLRFDGRAVALVDAEAPRWIDQALVTPVDVPLPRPAPTPEAVASRRSVEPRERRRVRTAPAANAVAVVSPEDAASAPPSAPATSAAPIPRTITYLDDDARALLPHENLYAAGPPKRSGDYYTPGDGSEDDVFYRPRALDPNPSRFAYAWRPRGNLIDDWLARVVEKVSGKVAIPLNAKFSLVCGTVAGVAGGCTIVRNGGTGVIVQRPPPAPWERSNRVQCRELRTALENAEEAAQVAYFLDRLSSLCSDAASDAEAGNDEARREAGLQEEAVPEAGPTQRDW